MRAGLVPRHRLQKVDSTYLLRLDQGLQSRQRRRAAGEIWNRRSSPTLTRRKDEYPAAIGRSAIGLDGART
jgi:hypothetical protein